MAVAVGILNALPSVQLCELLGRIGYGFVVLDLEHVLRGPDALEHAIRACELSGCEAWVRVPEIDEKLIGRVLDAGARGVVIPRTESATQIGDAIAAARFPPLGRRGLTGGRVTGFGNVDLPTYIAQANANIRIVPMIESAAGVAALPEILAIPGVALVMEGALDLALDLGLGPQPTHPQVWELLLQLHAQCRAANVPFCPNPRTDAQRAHWLQQPELRWLLAGEDRALIQRALRGHLAGLAVPQSLSACRSTP
ncbi:HpcH/HpaI aldolase family protein [Xanthomonas phaseoli]|uniref:4-hydroxy-2-oxovalerate aldolase n=1 Tax=Xanthomonas phaseoli pv. dieffenbachiae TaxID=92828 RepID=A0A1V9HEG6_9XANT|nr:aldolase/citrate lyase family protein [Xanthomonas phaseoli]MBO9789952.1 4-hydroxy-2-oxovalerate aldolase [Xanthomonas phaseoli pv. dieffenbachiae]MBO9834280.1 4-hydroxy-2-oxovalerate aldolase [Xanthomonas phaseoli pv. dieffenbachiae]MBO9836710.1 4-hydroxy-2-oxovalerate aldolase [Xanthomonas phaseoli pv. dieffenbachiae]MBO9841938.1 4-hydroxy-2-oxovalerate aldolase [Xanthomonas phaseoli pv. dieffenbachiae]MBO9852775.1 4-hydroxy-2-oxovalerate aldolase [Xanthomonas phaseoli pv. dieffenbachiae]